MALLSSLVTLTPFVYFARFTLLACCFRLKKKMQRNHQESNAEPDEDDDEEETEERAGKRDSKLGP